MTAKPRNLDLELKLRLRRVLFLQGYWCPIEVELSHYEHNVDGVKRTSLTDLDVLGVQFDKLFNVHKVVGDCKTGRNVSDANRLFWLKGVMDYFGANQAYFVRPTVDHHAKAIAPKMNLRVLNESDLAILEKSLNVSALSLPMHDWILQEQIDDLWGLDIPKGIKPTKEDLLLKSVYSYLSYSFWYIESYRNLFTLVGQFEKIAALIKPGDMRHDLLAYTGAERFAYALLELCSYIQSQGGGEVIKTARVYLYGGGLGLKDKEQFFDLLRKATGASESLDPFWLPQVLELVNRLIRNPAGASDVLRHISAVYLWCVHLKSMGLPPVSLNSETNTAAVVLTKDICDTFTKICGLPEATFAAMRGL